MIAPGTNAKSILRGWALDLMRPTRLAFHPLVNSRHAATIPPHTCKKPIPFPRITAGSPSPKREQQVGKVHPEAHLVQQLRVAHRDGNVELPQIARRCRDAGYGQLTKRGRFFMRKRGRARFRRTGWFET